MNPEQYEYENNHADRFHDYEEDSVDGMVDNWPGDSWNDEPDYYLDDNLEEGEYDEREDNSYEY